ncbi:hypothetical protein FYJ75_03435 [Roseburia sp. MUC/MUC-530-WT-4D]|uniref:HipA-like C-terminal domain-containing protein n=2 Tax=Roseburia porci TaxID=2605790 RepID=A0A6L5YNX1_9FIRM|nr:hypothetical protein [Roseburia porci]
MLKMIDFTNCEVDLTTTYGGSDKKRPIIYNGNRYMLKLSDRIPEEKRNPLNSSYTNSAFSEHIGCSILKTMGFTVQDTLLGEITMISSKGIERTYPVVACKNFIPDGKSLVEFKTIENAVLTSKPPKTPRLTDIYEIMQHDNPYFSKEFGEKAIESYWDLFIADGLLGNFDRHANNWGYLIDNVTKEIELAPVYDCGSSLYPQLSDDKLLDIINNQSEIQKRIDTFPKAALQDENKEKVSYKDYISSFQNQDCTDALIRVFPKIDIDKIHDVIDNCGEISDIRKLFYKTMVDARYEQIILEPYRDISQKLKEIRFSELSNLTQTEKSLVKSITFSDNDMLNLSENSLEGCSQLEKAFVSEDLFVFIGENFGNEFFSGTMINSPFTLPEEKILEESIINPNRDELAELSDIDGFDPADDY